MIDQTVAQYHIIERIGLGGGGEVFLARDTLLERRVALKFLTSERSDRQARKRFMTEARAAAAIDHPYICKIYEIGKVDDQLFIVMEYVKGRNLRVALDRGLLTVKQRLRIAIEITDALHTAHSRGVVHRDLKPSNIMITLDGHVKVMDFGLAKRLPIGELGTDQDHTTTKTGVAVGTPAYMSPEQAECQRVDPRSDIFSLGIILYEMLTGIHPFRKDVPVLTMMAIINEPPPPVSTCWAECPKLLDRIVERMLEKDAALRFQSSADVHDDLIGITESMETTSTTFVRQPIKTIAVLPFASISNNPEHELFSDGITEEIILQLTRISGLRIISRTSVMHFKGSDLDLETIGVQLAVDAVAEGSVRWSGSRVGISGKLIEVSSGMQLWADSFNLDVEDIFSIQEKVAEQIAAALEKSIRWKKTQASAADIPQSFDAYQSYLKGRYFLNKLSPADILKAIEHFHMALDVDPAYARAYAGLSTCFSHAGHQGYLPIADSFPKARAAAEKALEIDSSLAEAHTAMALIKLLHDWDFAGADEEFRRAITINPNNAEARLLHSWYAAARGRLEEATLEAKRAVELDPLSLMASFNLGWVLMYAVRFNEAIEVLSKTLELTPGFVIARLCLATVYLMHDRGDEAIPIFEEHADSRSQLAQAYAMAGRCPQAREILNGIISGTQPHKSAQGSAYDIGLTFLLLGDLDQGFAWLEQSYQERDSKILYLEHSPELRHLRDHPRFIRFFQRFGAQSS